MESSPRASSARRNTPEEEDEHSEAPKQEDDEINMRQTKVKYMKSSFAVKEKKKRKVQGRLVALVKKKKTLIFRKNLLLEGEENDVREVDW